MTKNNENKIIPNDASRFFLNYLQNNLDAVGVTTEHNHDFVQNIIKDLKKPKKGESTREKNKKLFF
jgi:hypothetical protein